MVDQAVRDKARPFAVAPADCHVDVVAGEIGNLARGGDPHRNLRMFDLEAADMRRQPLRGKGRHDA